MTITKAFSFPISISDLDRTYSLEQKVCEPTIDYNKTEN